MGYHTEPHHTQPSPENGIKKSWSQRYAPPKRVVPKLLRSRRFVKKHNKKNLKKMQASNA